MDNLLELLLPNTGDPNLQLPDPLLRQFYFDLDNRIFWIDSEIADSTLDVIHHIMQWNREDKDLPVEERKPIKIMVNSLGGSLEVAKVLIEIFKISKTPIYSYAFGCVASAASMIYLAAHKRFALPSVTFIVHRGSCENIGGDYNQINQFMEDYKKQIAELEVFYKEKTTFAPEIIEDKMNKGDWYIKVEEAMENGMVDQIIADIDELL